MRKMFSAFIFCIISIPLFSMDADGQYFKELSGEAIIHVQSRMILQKKTEYFELTKAVIFDKSGENVGIGFNSSKINLVGSVFIYNYPKKDIADQLNGCISYYNSNTKKLSVIDAVQFELPNDKKTKAVFSVVKYNDTYKKTKNSMLYTYILIMDCGQWYCKVEITSPESEQDKMNNMLKKIVELINI